MAVRELPADVRTLDHSVERAVTGERGPESQPVHVRRSGAVLEGDHAGVELDPVCAEMRTEVRVKVAHHGGQHTSVPDLLTDGARPGRRATRTHRSRAPSLFHPSRKWRPVARHFRLNPLLYGCGRGCGLDRDPNAPLRR